VANWRHSEFCYVPVFLITLCSAVCGGSSYAWAGGVQFGFGVDVSPPVVVERAPPPPPVMVERLPAPPPVVVQRTPPPPPVLVERTLPPPPVVVERMPPEVVYEGPVVVERRSVYYYYRPSYQYHSYQVETERNYYRHRSPDWEDDGAY